MKKTFIDIAYMPLKSVHGSLENNKALCIDKQEILEVNNKDIVMDEISINNSKTLESNPNERTTAIKVNLGCAVLDDYRFIGAYKVNEENIDDINEFLKGKELFKRGDIKKEANSAAINLIRINEGNGTIFNYRRFEIHVVSSYLSIINDFIFRLKMKQSKNLTVYQISKCVDNTIIMIDKSIKKINEGVASQNDYQNVGMKNINSEILPNINDYLKDKNLKTPNKIIYEVERFFYAVNKISMGIGTINNYNAIGVRLDGRKIKVINSILKGIYERDKHNLNIKEVLDISISIKKSFLIEDKENK